MARKVADGNCLAEWFASLILETHTLMGWWLENPHTSWMWFLPLYLKLEQLPGMQRIVVDYCRFGTPWRKRTRFLVKLPSITTQKCLCNCTCAHTVLRGHNPNGFLYTKLAEPYPLPLASALARAQMNLAWQGDAQHINLERLSQGHGRKSRAEQARK